MEVKDEIKSYKDVPFKYVSVTVGKLAKNCIIDGVYYKKDKSTNIEYDIAGAVVRWGTLHGNQTIQGITLKDGHHVSYHDNGKLEFGVLHGDQIINGKEYNDGETIELEYEE